VTGGPLFEQPLPEEHDQMESNSSPPADGAGDTQGRRSMLADVSNEMVRIYKDYFGRGPTSARANWVGQDTLVVLLEDTLAPVERNLIKLGEHQRLRESRMFFQYATVKEFCEPVERLTGRKVRAFLSGIDTEVDGLSTEMFVLHPAGYDGPSRKARAEP
jgi:uncharacterized protein YbcI